MTMKRMYAATAMAALLLTACASTSRTLVVPDEALFARGAGELEFTTIEVPGAMSTQAWGIGPTGDVVGHYVSGDVTLGFLLQGGTFTPIEFPGASLTEARAISPSGEIVGTYKLPGDAELRWRSFVRSPEGEFRDLAIPGHESTMAQRILPDGTIVGCVHGDDFGASMKGFVMDRRGTRIDDIPASMHNGATPDLRRIVGLYTDPTSGPRKGYIIDDGDFRPFQFPDGGRTEAWDVNPDGDVVGFYVLPGPPPLFRGFLLIRDVYTTIHIPGAMHTRVFGINTDGDIVGDYVSDGVARGFLASRSGRPHR
jgi:hypothetical protein